MIDRIECINSKNEVFFAHFIGTGMRDNIINYKCGVCIYADILFDFKTKIILNLPNDRCTACKSGVFFTTGED